MFVRLFSYVVEVTIALSFVILILLLQKRRIDRKYSARCRYYLWLILALRLAVPLNFSLPVSFVRIVAPYRLSGSVPSNPMPGGSPFPQEVSSMKPGALFGTVSIVQVLTAIWLIGACCYFLYHIVQYSIFKNNILRWSNPVDEKVLHQFYAVKYELRIYRNVRIRYSSAIKTPMITGFLHPCIVLPACPLQKRVMEMVLRHELTHFRRNDMYFKLLLLFVSAMHWFNPLVHLMVHQAEKAIETSCDSEVVGKRGGNFIQSYAEAIVEVARLTLHQGKFNRTTVLAAYLESSKEILQQRFANLFQEESRKSGRSFLFLVTSMTVIGSTLIWFRGNDHNLQWAKNITPYDIEAVEVIMPSGAVNGTVSKTLHAKQAIADWLNRIDVEPALLKQTEKIEEITYIITQRDGSIFEISKLDDRSVSMNGKEYRFPIIGATKSPFGD